MISQAFVLSFIAASAIAAPGSPSSLMSMSKVRLATKMQTEANDGSTVWVMNTFYEDSCSGDVIKIQYWSSDVCLQLDTGSVSFSCTMGEDHFTQTFYSDNACSVISNAANIGVGNCLLNDIDDDGYLNDDGAWDFNEYSCTTSAPSPLSGASVASSELYTYETTLLDKCYNNYDGTAYTSFLIDLPYGYSFTGTGCAPANISTAAYKPVGTCQPSGINGSTVMYNTFGSDDDEDNDDSSDGLTSRDKLAIGISFGFIGGVVVTAIALYFCCIRGKSPLSAKEDGVNNI